MAPSQARRPSARGFQLRGRAPRFLGRHDELSVLGSLVNAVWTGDSQVLVLRGEPGVGKTALLDWVAGQARESQVARTAGVQSEMELAFAGLHQLCAGLLGHLDGLPDPQRDALRIAFGLSAGPAPDRFLVGLAVLSLLSDAAGVRPLLCLIDDEQWLDRASAQVLGFVARRLAAEPVGLVFAARTPGEDLAGLPELAVGGLGLDESRALLDSVLTGPLDARVRDQIVADTRGNPLALVELPRGMTPEQLAGGFGLPGAVPLSGRIEESFRRQLDSLPDSTRRLVQLAAADPSGDPVLVWRAADALGIQHQAAEAARSGLIEFGAQIRFRHPLVRSAAYQSASVQDRQLAHRALAQATDAELDPDRRAWHRAQGADGPDEEVAAELERSADRAQARGGMAAAAAFAERAAVLTPDPGRRARRLLAAARAKRDAGAPDAALGLLVAVEAGPPDEPRAAEVEWLRGQIAFDQRRGTDAARLLLSAATHLEPFDLGAARETHLESLVAAMWADDRTGVRQAATAAQAAPPGPPRPRVVNVLLEALATRLAEGYTVAAPALADALTLLLALNETTDEASDQLWLAASRGSGIVALELWDFAAWQNLAASQVRYARESGALVHLQSALTYLGWTHIVAGDLAAASNLLEEGHLITEATGSSPIEYTEMMLAAWRGSDDASALIEVTDREAAVRGLGRMVSFAAYARAVLHNGLGRYDVAARSAKRAFERDPVGHGPLVVTELAEAASRTGDTTLFRAALDWVAERTRMNPSEWALGIEARVRALASDAGTTGTPGTTESFYRESIDQLSCTRIRPELARGHLLYGEWLRRQGRRVDAREQLRTAQKMLEAMGLDAFAERARRELLATGETVRRRTTRSGAAREALTAQETQVARLAVEGLSNPEIGARLFISARTVQYHLSKVFAKLGVSSRSQLHRVLPGLIPVPPAPGGTPAASQGARQGPAQARPAGCERDIGAFRCGYRARRLIHGHQRSARTSQPRPPPFPRRGRRRGLGGRRLPAWRDQPGAGPNQQAAGRPVRRGHDGEQVLRPSQAD